MYEFFGLQTFPVIFFAISAILHLISSDCFSFRHTFEKKSAIDICISHIFNSLINHRNWIEFNAWMKRTVSIKLYTAYILFSNKIYYLCLCSVSMRLTRQTIVADILNFKTWNPHSIMSILYANDKIRIQCNHNEQKKHEQKRWFQVNSL